MTFHSPRLNERSQARRHGRSAAVVLVASAALGLTGCAENNTTNEAEFSSAATRQETQAEPTGDAPRTSQCKTSNLELSVANLQGAAGSKDFDIVFKNIGDDQCTLEGYPGVSLVTDNNGTQLGEAAERENGVKPKPVTLAPDATATAAVSLTNAGALPPHECQPTLADGLRVYPPNETASAFIKVNDLEGCHGKEKLLKVLPVTSDA
ncbi:DUF4232 domain-containing protein [Corynebacterium sp. zg254]|uniref:DUF4232 domain-containing protein n=1 Tax=Corynebacterium zhongnanshanii TaxID=2768834 RepID=A0ABQ6VFG0_9CORY|nr:MULTISPECIES: DUF4232 domain-containing protein [Corynebacterium]KAB3523157.1 DUF4232 domain-containing protein [Corynebacterium zhongnanshanii]MCR5913737.1 DUF4232 domain-containing protein [Corynebacterium sp. zg254]